ncbi:MAG: alpha-ketoacid dehydrogenase subunit beta [Deltaproteobacteria bacterium CG_4_10_14_0_2_um_filter_43_8]|nr:MAG: alpha-ketoacid dehydrogenase subunit beta [Deltaproteobacteria bacterium CG11_big_fil_rev_8_21_14_0_20_42_23]PJA21728.1 MAG: alpha-ketoacid dehydrogenase subunit beta [Deltaproteobacteria bacterium CG_4_10_14_0_2_um_filter_43_8]PJC64564.1 MAG: alpha-ketoacid dehydrogenase subunit beta [Deltaproteobacteria bacterium CG_4_9_14_0_2_um_filter_42_21]
MTEQKRIMSFGNAIREGLTEAAVRDASVLFMAEGLTDPSSVFGTTADIGKHIDSKRMIEMPLSENGLCGVAIGSAMMGKRPVISFHRVEFALLAIEQIVNNAAKAHYVSNGKHKVPMVIRLIVGRGWGQGPEHSQSIEAIFSHFPGLKVIMPTYPDDAKGLIIAAVEDENPVIVIEHRWCHYVNGHVPEGYYVEPIDGPRKVHPGKDLTIVATSYMTLEAVRAAKALETLGYSASVFDLRVLRPLKLDRIFESVQQTGRLLTIDTGFKQYGVGSEIVSSVVDHCFSELKVAPMRMGLPDHPTPSSRGLIQNFYPDSISILRNIQHMLGLDKSDIEAVISELIVQRGGLAIDVPDAFFKGPF